MSLAHAMKIAFEAHEGQVRICGEPYREHLMRVMMKMSNDKESTVAILHDVLEDTPLTAQCLINMGVGGDEVQYIEILTRGKNQSYEDYICQVDNAELAIKVKIADLEDNLNITRLKKLGDSDLKRINKYLKALRKLKQNN